MRRSRSWILTLITILVLSACGSSHHTASSSIQKELEVHVYFASEATPAQEDYVGSRLRADARIKAVIFISKARALAKMKKEFPQLFKTKLRGNPLPDSYTVVPVHANDTALIGQSVSRAHWPGVSEVHWGSLTSHTRTITTTIILTVPSSGG